MITMEEYRIIYQIPYTHIIVILTIQVLKCKEFRIQCVVLGLEFDKKKWLLMFLQKSTFLYDRLSMKH